MLDAIEFLTMVLTDTKAKVMTPSGLLDTLTRHGSLLRSSSKGRRNGDAAIFDLQTALEIADNNTKALCKLGLWYKKTKSHGDTERIYESTKKPCGCQNRSLCLLQKNVSLLSRWWGMLVQQIH